MEHRILQEEEVRTPPRKEAHGHGGGASGARSSVTSRRDTSSSPGNVLEDTVARMQKEMAEIRAENRLLRTPGVQPVVPTPRQAAFTTTKVPWFVGRQLGAVSAGL